MAPPLRPVLRRCRANSAISLSKRVFKGFNARVETIELPDALSELLSLSLADCASIDREVYAPSGGVYLLGRQLGYFPRPALFGLSGGCMAKRLGVPRKWSFAPWDLPDDERRLIDKFRAIAFAERGDFYRALWHLGMGDGFERVIYEPFWILGLVGTYEPRDKIALDYRALVSAVLPVDGQAIVDNLIAAHPRYPKARYWQPQGAGYAGWETFDAHCDHMRGAQRALAKARL